MTAPNPLKPLLCGLVASLLASSPVRSAPPGVPFAGVYGATAGAGSLVGWERLGGLNPAVLGPAGVGFSAAGYAPFGLEDVRVTEVNAFCDGRRFGVAAEWRHLADEGGADASRVRLDAAWRALPGVSSVTVGAFSSLDVEGGEHVEPGYGAGVLVRATRFASLGFAWDDLPDVWGRASRAQAGLDAGTPLPRLFGRSSAWRVGVEYARVFRVPSGVERREWRFGLGLRLHDMMGLYAGYAPQRHTAGLGVRFGLGGFEGFSAVRRHAALGGTAVQGVGWSFGRGR